MKKIWTIITGSFLALLITKPLLACSTCAARYTQDKLDAYLIVTLLLSMLPMVITVAIVLLVRKNRKSSVE